MPSIRANGIGFKARSGDKISSFPDANLRRFSEAYENDAKGTRGIQIFLFALTGFFIVFFVSGMIACRLIIRHRARKYVKKLEEPPPEMKNRKKSVLKSLGLRAAIKKVALKAKPARAPASDTEATPAPSSPTPASGAAGTAPEDVDSAPGCGSHQASSVVEPTSEQRFSEGEKLPEIVVSSIEEDIFSELDINILPHSALANDDSHADESDQSNSTTFVSAVETADLADASAFSSFFSVQVLEEMSSIAEDLKDFSYAKSIDGEIKSVGSRRSSVVVVEHEHQRQAVSYSAECVAECNDAEIAINAINAIKNIDTIISHLEVMARPSIDDDRSVYSQESLKSYFSFSNITAKTSDEGKSEQKSISASIRDVTELSAPPLSPPTTVSSADTTLVDEATLVSSPFLKDNKAMSPVTDKATDDLVETVSPTAIVDSSLEVPRTPSWFRLSWRS